MRQLGARLRVSILIFLTLMPFTDDRGGPGNLNSRLSGIFAQTRHDMSHIEEKNHEQTTPQEPLTGI
jgi:hypothetical protein